MPQYGSFSPATTTPGTPSGSGTGSANVAAAAGKAGPVLSGGATKNRAVVDPARLGLPIHAVIRLRTTHARIAACLEHFARVPEVTGVARLTGEDCFLLDVRAASAERLEAVVDGIARFGPVTTSLVLRDYEPKPLRPAGELTQ
jgi:Lrp/AsnC family leucine-responsive transcriptional regulator